MHKRLSNLIEDLNKLAAELQTLNSGQTRLNASQGWQIVPVPPDDLAEYPRDIARNIAKHDIDNLSDAFDDALIYSARAVEGLREDVVPSFNSSPVAGYNAVLITLNYVGQVIGPHLGWTLVEKGALPSATARRIQKISSDVDALAPQHSELEERLALITGAAQAAEELPTSLAELKHAQTTVRAAVSSTAENMGQIKTHLDAVEQLQARARAAALSAESDAATASESLRIAASAGLAASFAARERALNVTVYLWTVGLIVALVVIGWVGAARIAALRDALQSPGIDSLRIWAHIALSIFSVGAPIWFAWIATKQISQRFRLSEDYGFKASIATAYEGYRREAIRIDPNFERALFASALKRLDEPPLRLMELSTHGSPGHELANSSVVRKALDGLLDLPSKMKSSKEPKVPTHPEKPIVKTQPTEAD